MSNPKILETVLETVGDDGPMAVLRKRSASDEPLPLAVIFHDAPGVRDAVHTFARQLAGCGYDVVVPDLHHRHGRMIGFTPEMLASDPQARPRMYEMLTSLTDEGIQHDLDTALDAVRNVRPPNPGERHVCIGFCLGARAVFRTMTRLPRQFAAGAMWHPSFLVDDEPDSPHLTAGELSGGLYIGFGEADQLQPVAIMQPFIDAVSALGDRVVIDIHPDTDHGYTWPSAPTYNERAAQRSWRQTLDVFSAALTGST